MNEQHNYWINDPNLPPTQQSSLQMQVELKLNVGNTELIGFGQPTLTRVRLPDGRELSPPGDQNNRRRSNDLRHNRNPGEPGGNFNVVLPIPPRGTDRFARIEGMVEVRVGSQQRHSVTLGPINAVLNRTARIEQLPEGWLKLASPDQNSMELRIAESYNDRLAGFELVTAAGRSASLEHWGGGSNNDFFSYRFRAPAAQSDSLRLWFYDQTRTFSLPFALMDVKLPGPTEQVPADLLRINFDADAPEHADDWNVRIE